MGAGSAVSELFQDRIETGLPGEWTRIVFEIFPLNSSDILSCFGKKGRAHSAGLKRDQDCGAGGELDDSLSRKGHKQVSLRMQSTHPRV